MTSDKLNYVENKFYNAAYIHPTSFNDYFTIFENIHMLSPKTLVTLA